MFRALDASISEVVRTLIEASSLFPLWSYFPSGFSLHTYTHCCSVAIIGMFAFMQLLGFSINLLVVCQSYWYCSG